MNLHGFWRNAAQRPQRRDYLPSVPRPPSAGLPEAAWSLEVMLGGPSSERAGAAAAAALIAGGGPLPRCQGCCCGVAADPLFRRLLRDSDGNRANLQRFFARFRQESHEFTSVFAQFLQKSREFTSFFCTIPTGIAWILNLCLHDSDRNRINLHCFCTALTEIVWIYIVFCMILTEIAWIYIVLHESGGNRLNLHRFLHDSDRNCKNWHCFLHSSDRNRIDLHCFLHSSDRNRMNLHCFLHDSDRNRMNLYCFAWVWQNRMNSHRFFAQFRQESHEF